MNHSDPEEGQSHTAGDHQRTLRELERALARLLSGSALRFDDRIRSGLPESDGVYRIFDPAVPNRTLRAGRTKSAAGGLRQRIYHHLMGNQQGNLRAQLVSGGTCADMESAKAFIREKLAVQVLVVEDDVERIWVEHFVLSVLRPTYCD